jgi:hypothetical protein
MGVCLLTKKQSAWAGSVIMRELRLPYIPSRNSVVVGDFSVKLMGNAFNRNNNGHVMRVMHIAEADAACAAYRAEADARRVVL